MGNGLFPPQSCKQRQETLRRALQQQDDGQAEHQRLEVPGATGQARNPVVELIAQDHDECRSDGAPHSHSAPPMITMNR